MLSAFSFGKIIKTFLPGSLLSAALLLVAEALWQMLRGQSIIAMIAANGVIVATTAALLPLTLILGFVLNTVVWLAINGRMRASVHRRLRKSTAYVALQSALLHRLRVGLKRVAPTLDGVDSRLESLEYFYLPVVTLERHNTSYGKATFRGTSSRLTPRWQQYCLPLRWFSICWLCSPAMKP